LRNVPLKLVADAVGLNFVIDYQGCVEEHTNSESLSKLHIVSGKQNRSIIKYEHLQQSLSVPKQGLSVEIDEGAVKRDNSRLSICSNSDSRWRENSRTKPSKACSHCGRIRTERFCECRKSGTPKNSQKGSNSTLRAAESSTKPNKSPALNSSSARLCRTRNIVRQLFRDDEYCGECIGVYGIRRCPNCNQLYELNCGKCKRC